MQELSKENNDLKSRIEKLEAMMNTQQSVTAQDQSVISNMAVKISSSATAALGQNMPNPFNRTTTINYTLPQQFSTAKIIITDNAGRSMKEIKVSGTGKNSLAVDASTLTSGTYYYALYIDGKLIGAKQMLVVK